MPATDPLPNPSTSEAHAAEVRLGQRFEFGQNWQRFLTTLDDERILQAEASLRQMLAVESLKGKSFLDIGSGSGLFSLAARRLGARVHSFDYDPQSVACTTELRHRYAPADPEWTVDHASVLDRHYIDTRGTFDYVYSWGVLHQTGEMWKALDHARIPVAPRGKLFISIYNDQGGRSRRWLTVKRLYNRSGRFIRLGLVLGVGAYFESRAALIRLVRLQNPLPFQDWALKKRTRGMSVWHDLVDWVGGYPFEVARPEEVLDFFLQREFTLVKLRTLGSGHGCNEYVFERAPSARVGDDPPEPGGPH